MPIDIVTSGTTDPVNGIITKQDLLKMKQNFIRYVNVKPVGKSGPIVKKFSVSVMKDEIKDLIEFYENGSGIDVITINFAVHNNLIACNGTNLSNSLTVVVEAAKFKDINNPVSGLIPHSTENEVVVIPGYSSVDKRSAAQKSACCPSANP